MLQATALLAPMSTNVPPTTEAALPVLWLPAQTPSARAPVAVNKLVLSIARPTFNFNSISFTCLLSILAKG